MRGKLRVSWYTPPVVGVDHYSVPWVLTTKLVIRFMIPYARYLWGLSLGWVPLLSLDSSLSFLFVVDPRTRSPFPVLFDSRLLSSEP